MSNPEWSTSIVCPLCGYEDQDGWDIDDVSDLGDYSDEFCDECCEPMRVHIKTSIQYKAELVSDAEGEGR